MIPTIETDKDFAELLVFVAVAFLADAIAESLASLEATALIMLCLVVVAGVEAV